MREHTHNARPKGSVCVSACTFGMRELCL